MSAALSTMSTARNSPVPVQPDVEAFVWAHIKTVKGVTSFLVTVITDWPQWQRRYTIQVDARASSKKGAADRAETVRQIICALPDADWPDGVITYVQPVEGPFWLPDDADGCPRYTARYELRAHPRTFVPAPGLS